MFQKIKKIILIIYLILILPIFVWGFIYFSREIKEIKKEIEENKRVMLGNEQKLTSRMENLNKKIAELEEKQDKALAQNLFIDPDLNWILYENKYYKYRIRFPIDWKYELRYNQNPSLMLYDPIALQRSINGGLGQGIKIEIYHEDSDLPLEEYAENKIRNVVLLEKKQININKKQAIFFRFLSSRIASPTMYVETFIKNNNKVYIIIGYIPKPEEREKYLDIYNQILQGFFVF